MNIFTSGINFEHAVNALYTSYLRWRLAEVVQPPFRWREKRTHVLSHVWGVQHDQKA